MCLTVTPNLSMNSLKVLVIAGLLMLAAGESQAGQRRRTGRPTATPSPKVANPVPTPAPVTPARNVAPQPIAIVNGQTLTTADLDPRVRQEIESLEEKVAQTRRDILDVAINTTLLELEARKRKLTTTQLYSLEVIKRVPEPTPAQITKFIQENRD